MALIVAAGGLAACTAGPDTVAPEEQPVADRDPSSSAPPPHIRAWMDRLTVAHEYDPETGFIVAREVIELPAEVGSGLAEAVEQSRATGTPLVVFATADRCAPCQEYKKSAINDPAVVEMLGRRDVLVAHVEVDREPELAESILGSRSIPMTYLLRDGTPVDELRGQRSAKELLAWLRGHASGDQSEAPEDRAS